jgi:hypothetical protein
MPLPGTSVVKTLVMDKMCRQPCRKFGSLEEYTHVLRSSWLAIYSVSRVGTSTSVMGCKTRNKRARLNQHPPEQHEGWMVTGQ